MSFSLYGWLIGLALVVFWWLWEKRIQSIHPPLSTEQLNWGLVALALGALLGARLYHLLTDWSLYTPGWNWKSDWPVLFQTWQGGLGLYGALLGGVAGLGGWWRRFHPPRSWWQILDAAALALPWSQAIGRWGNFFNQELYGPPTTLPWGISLTTPPQALAEPVTAAATQLRFHPLFLYESLASLGLGCFLWLMYRHFRTMLPLGSRFYTGVYCVTYGTIRFGLEFLRLDSAPGWPPFSVAQWVSLSLVGLGLLLLPRVFRLQ